VEGATALGFLMAVVGAYAPASGAQAANNSAQASKQAATASTSNSSENSPGPQSSTSATTSQASPAPVTTARQAPQSSAASAQSETPIHVTAKIPRMADGHPDLTGVWQGGSNRVGTWEETNSGDGPMAASGPVSPFAITQPQPKPSYQAWAAAKVMESYKMRGVDEPMVRCLPPGIPRTTLMGLFPMQIVQTPQAVVMLYEVFHLFRYIPIGAQHPDDVEPSYMGDSVAHWEGDTLVVDVAGFNDKTWLSGVGTFHSEKLHVVEKYTRMDENTIVYESRAEDPAVLTEPWVRKGTIMLRPGTRLQEYECAENNEDLKSYEEMMKDPSVFMRK
jgi:hypothetical protein